LDLAAIGEKTGVNGAIIPDPKLGLPLETERGSYAILLTILTEAFLFIVLFASYFMLGNNKDRWRIDRPPQLSLALIMLGVLLVSSLVIYWGEKQLQQGRYKNARVALGITVLIGLVFMVLQGFEYHDHWKHLTPFTDSYGSIFYTITSFHAAHLIVGILMLIYILFLRRYEPVDRAPYRPYHVGALYWHFVDIVWIFVVAILYLGPRL
jgi:heme/copper-type cytochrome/quinol oxidase subunit 3